jgi:glycosyltransferase involved in cell wall biosynthesis
MQPFIIITPAHNEAAFIAKTAESVIAQTVRPLKWIVVDDASTDGTSSIIENYARQYPFVELITVKRPPGRHFGNKVNAFNAGCQRVSSSEYELIGNLDADIEMDSDYYEKLLNRFQADPKLGVGGGMVHTRLDGDFVTQNVALDSVAGAVQLFRKECFEKMGGYKPMPNGGIDTAAEIAVRMQGFTARTFPELVVREHRLTGSAVSGPLGARLKEGRRMHSLGYSPLFFLFRCIYRMFERPSVVGSMAAYWGFLASVIARRPIAVSGEMVRFLRAEQHLKLRHLLRRKQN